MILRDALVNDGTARHSERAIRLFSKAMKCPVFDVRCLPNPYWMPDLRAYSGRDEPVRDYLVA